jgi:hypothetical protein
VLSLSYTHFIVLFFLVLFSDTTVYILLLSLLNFVSKRALNTVFELLLPINSHFSFVDMLLPVSLVHYGHILLVFTADSIDFTYFDENSYWTEHEIYIMGTWGKANDVEMISIGCERVA